MKATIACAVPAVVVVVVLVACGAPTMEMPPVGSQSSGVLVVDTVTRTDAHLWTHRPNEKRGVRVTLGIPAGMDSVVIERVDGDGESRRDSVEFMEVNSVRVLAPLKLRRISVRSTDGDGMMVEVIVRLGHCKRLDLVASMYWDGGPVDGSVGQLPQKHKLADCCVPPSSGEALDTADAQGGRPDATPLTREPKPKMTRSLEPNAFGLYEMLGSVSE